MARRIAHPRSRLKERRRRSDPCSRSTWVSLQGMLFKLCDHSTANSQPWRSVSHSTTQPAHRDEHAAPLKYGVFECTTTSKAPCGTAAAWQGLSCVRFTWRLFPGCQEFLFPAFPQHVFGVPSLRIPLDRPYIMHLGSPGTSSRRSMCPVKPFNYNNAHGLRSGLRQAGARARPRRRAWRASSERSVFAALSREVQRPKTTH